MCVNLCVYAIGPKRTVELEACLLRGHLQGVYLPRSLAEKVSGASENDEGGRKT